MAGSLHIQLLGDFRLLHDGVPVTGIDTPRSQSLLAYMLLHRSVSQSRARLAFLFWPDSDEAQARTNLRKQLHYLRRDLPDADRYLHADGSVLYWQSSDGVTLDVAEFEEALAAATAAEQAGDEDRQLAALERAVDRYQGDLLPDSYDDWVLDERRRLQEACAGALLALAALHENHRHYQLASDRIQYLLHLDPLHEPGYRQLMRLQALQGNRAAALRTYQTCAARLEQELGVSPSAATMEVYQQLLAQEGNAIRPAPEAGFASPLVGRNREWAQLQAAWQATRGGQRQLVEIAGEAGIGKTRLAEELLVWAGRQGIPTASAHCHASDRTLAYRPVVSWLRSEPLQQTLKNLEPAWLSELCRLLPELPVERPGIPTPRPMFGRWQRQHLFEAVAQPFARHSQLMLLVDDLHWADAETLEWLTHLVHAHSPSGHAGQLLVVATVRTGENGDQKDLRTLLDDLRHSRQLIQIELGPLTEAESLALARNVAGQSLEPAVEAGLYRESEGNPFFVVEMVRAAILSSGDEAGGPTPLPGKWGLPPAVQGAISARLARLSPAALDLASVAAVIGRRCTFDVLAQAVAAPDTPPDEEAIVRALDELWHGNILAQEGGTAFSFTHDKIRQVVYDGLSPARRRYLHRRVAEAWVATRGDDLDPLSGQIAEHFERGGRPAEAIGYYRRAAAVARRVYAHEEAIGYYRRLLESDLSQRLPRDGACAIMLELGEVWQLTGDWDAADEIYRQALVQAEILEDQGLMARSQQAIGNLARLKGNYDEALEWLSLARGGFEATGEQGGLAQVLWAEGEAQWYLGDHQQALAALERQMAITRETGDTYGFCDAAGTMGIVYWSLGDFERARAFCRQSMETAEEIDYWWAVGRALVTMGNTYMGEGRLEPAFASYEQALAVGEEIGDRQCRSWAATNIGNLYSMAGDPDSALGCYQFGLEIALDIGDRWAIAIGLVDIGQAYAEKGQVVPAEDSYRKGIALARALGVNYLGEYLMSLAGFYADQGRFAEAQLHNREAMQLAGQPGHRHMGGENTLFRCRLLDARLRYALGQIDQGSALAELEGMLADCDGDAQKARIWHELWRLSPSHQVNGQQVTDLYRGLPATIVYGDIRRGYRAIIGEDPPAPRELTFSPETLGHTPAAVDALLARADGVIATLSAGR